MNFDPRLTPARPDLAATHLKGKVDAPRFVEGITQQVIVGMAPVRKEPSHQAPLLTEASYHLAMASAMPWKVLDLIFHRSAVGGSFQTLPSLPSTMFVGVSFGRFLSQKQVAFVSPWPNCQG